jgi:signal transduction histidine kinase/DNA-binding response OmpR family regulator
MWEVCAQSKEMLYLTLADTNSKGNLLLYTLDDWQFSFDSPETISDAKNLSNTIPGSIDDMRALKERVEWDNYGWFELEFYADSTLGGFPWVLTYGNPEPVKLWLNGRLVLQAGNPSEYPSKEKLALFFNSEYEGVMLREGVNRVLIEYSEHTFPERLKPYWQSEYGVWLVLYGENGPQLRRYRAVIFGGACMLLFLLMIVHTYLAVLFRGEYHTYVALTTFFMLIHAVTTLSDSLFDWSYAYVYFYQFSYAISFIFVVYYFLIAIRKIVGLSVPWKSLTAILMVSVLSGIFAVLMYQPLLNILHPVLAVGTLGFGVFSLYEAKQKDRKLRIGIITAGLVSTIGGAILYVFFYVALGSQSIWLFLVATLMAYVGIPVSLTFNVAANYANLISTLEQKVRDRTAALEAANEFQNRFFANISHEFRTPLTISEGLLNKAMKNKEELSDEQRLSFMVMKRNMSRLHDMVDQIIDLTKADKDHLALHQKYYPADKLVSISVESFRSLAEYHGHTLMFRPNCPDCILFADRSKFEVIVNNLISNAIKFTPDGGEIRITSAAEDQNFLLTVQDNGPGIPESEQENIFERFHRIKRSDEDYVEGMGVGLELSRTLARLHGGDLTLETEVSVGASFVVKIPLSDHSGQPIDLVEDSMGDELWMMPDIDQKTEEYTDFDILLVEDNKDMIAYVSDVLSEVGSIKQASHGKEALKALQSFTPDIIVTDLMMPEMNGLELVEELMNHPKWKEIPVMVLTAKALEADKSHLLRYGVVDYITKPFIPDHLLLKVKNLLTYYTRRKSIRLKMKTEAEPEVKQFSEKVADFIIRNIKNYNLTVDLLSSEFSQSRRSFYRNLQSETGMTPAEFIREVRLTTARNMVAGNENLRLEELADAVGYKSATSFRRAYENRFGAHPLG